MTRPVFARHAASLLLYRDGPHGIEVLMGVRGAGHRFMPNRLVFPGGATDPADRRAPAATEPDPATLALLNRRAHPRLARALVVAAARELTEETGLSFGAPPRLHSLRYLCRAVTPQTSPIRFNARFLTAPASETSGTPTDSHELSAVRFYPVQEALTLGLMPVTKEILQRFLTNSAEAPLAYKNQKWIPD